MYQSTGERLMVCLEHESTGERLMMCLEHDQDISINWLEAHGVSGA